MRGYTGDTVERICGSKIEIQKYPEVITLPGIAFAYSIRTVRTEYTAHSNIYISPPDLLRRIAVMVFLFFFLYQFHDSRVNVFEVAFLCPHFDE